VRLRMWSGEHDLFLYVHLVHFFYTELVNHNITALQPYSVISKVRKWDPIERALVIPFMFYSGLMMAESRPKHVALM
jgi:hypothetical protein